MERVSRFLWLPWLRGRALHQQRSQDGHLTYWEGEHNGYRRLRPAVGYRRSIVRLGAAHWLVLDTLQSTGTHRYRLHSLTPDLPYDWEEETGQLTLQTSPAPYHLDLGAEWSRSPISLSLVRADPQSPRGWQAPYYGAREPALSVAATAEGHSVLFWSLFGPDRRQVIMDGDNLRIEAEQWRARIRMQPDAASSVVATVWLDGAVRDQLEIVK